MTNKINLKIKPFDIRQLSKEFNKIAKKTFRTNLYNTNRAKYFKKLSQTLYYFYAIKKI